MPSGLLGEKKTLIAQIVVYISSTLWRPTKQSLQTFLNTVFEKLILLSKCVTHYNSHCGLLKIIRGLPWWRSGWESACWCRGHGFVPRSGRISHAAEQLGPWAMATEPAHPEPVLRNRRGHNSERPAYRKNKTKQNKNLNSLKIKLRYISLHSYRNTWPQTLWPQMTQI